MARVTSGDVRQRILDAAEHRLWHYGFKKTTIDEIAADAGVGKGTVYLYFESKEDIALAIVTHFKEASLEELQRIADSDGCDVLDKLKQMLTYPVTMAYRRCVQSPAAQEMVLAVRPHIQARLRPFQEREIALIAAVLEKGIQNGIFSIVDPLRTAGTLKTMCAGFLPPYSLIEGAEAIQAEIGRIVDLAFCGLCHPREKERCSPEGKAAKLRKQPIS